MEPTTLVKFESVWPALEKDILQHAEKYKLPEEYLSWFKKVSFRLHVETHFSGRQRLSLVECSQFDWTSFTSGAYCL